jgi:hypothetical protein
MIRTRNLYFPGWLIWLYLDDTVSDDHETAILANCTDNVVIKKFNFLMNDAYVKSGARYLPCHEAETVEVFIARDIDSSLTQLDAETVAKFLQDDDAVVLRYHEVFPFNSYLLEIGTTTATGKKMKYPIRSCEETFPEIKKRKYIEYYTHPNSFIGGGIGIKLRAITSPVSFKSYMQFIQENPDLLSEVENRRGYDELYCCAEFGDLANMEVEVVFLTGKRSGQAVRFQDVYNAKGQTNKKVVPSLLDYVYSK